MIRYRIIIAAVLLGVVGAACGDDGSAETTAPAPAPPAAEVTIVDFAFDPGTLTVPVGTEVTWTNQDDAPHTSTADEGSWNSGSLSTNGTFSHTFDTAGTFTYFCEIHPSMTATITVEG